MIHRESRDLLAQALRHYAAGVITNDDLDSVDVDWRDRGAVAVKEMAWGLYDDTHSHYVDERIPRNSEIRKVMVRWIAFLYSDEEYIWPEYSFIQFLNWPLNVLTLGWWKRMKQRRWEQFLEAGDFEVWPFCRREDLERIRRRPRLLSGSDA